MRRILICLLSMAMLAGCATTKTEKSPYEKPYTKQAKVLSPATISELENGKRLFKDGYYKKAMEQLLPLAVDGNMEAQYAVGYMYYYGFGAAQDTVSGSFWVRRSADQKYEPAIKAYAIIQQNHSIRVKKNEIY